MKTTEEFTNEINEVTLFIIRANQQIQEGEELELTGLDEKIDYLCAQIEAAPIEVSQPLQEHMTKMISALENLATTLEDKVDD